MNAPTPEAPVERCPRCGFVKFMVGVDLPSLRREAAALALEEAAGLCEVQSIGCNALCSHNCAHNGAKVCALMLRARAQALREGKD